MKKSVSPSEAVKAFPNPVLFSPLGGRPRNGEGDDQQGTGASKAEVDLAGRIKAGSEDEDEHDRAQSTSKSLAAVDKGSAVVPNTFMSSSNPAGAATVAAASTAADGGDVKLKGRGRLEEQQHASTSLSSSPSLPLPTPIPAPISLAFLDKVSAPFAPRSQAISPYGSSHPLYAAAKKFRLKTDPTASSSSTPAVLGPTTIASSSSKPKSQSSPSRPPPKARSPPPESRALKAPLAEAAEQPSNQPKGKEPEREQRTDEQGQSDFSIPSLSHSSSASGPADEMGSRPAYTRSQMRVQRRPSPLDIPAAKRRRSNGGSFHIVKVEDEEDDRVCVLGSEKEASAETTGLSNLPSSSVSTNPTFTSESSRQVSPAGFPLATKEQPRAASPATSIDLRSTIADEDSPYFAKELRTPSLRVPRELPRPTIVQDMDLTTLELDPSLEDIPLSYVLDNIALKGPLLLSTVVESAIAIPSTSTLSSSPISGSAIPSSVAVRTPTHLLNEAACPEYVLAVSSDETSRVMFLPIHGLVLATSCKSFAGLARPPSVEPSSVQEGEDTIRVLPVVHIHLPSSSAFSRLVPFFYAQEAGSLLSSLLPIQHLSPHSMTAAQGSPTLLASHLAKVDQQTLAQYVHFNHSIWKTTVALGAGRDELWKVLQASWNALVSALSIQHSAGASIKPKREEEEPSSI